MAVTSSSGQSSPFPISQIETFSTDWRTTAEIGVYTSEERECYNERLREELVHLSGRVDHLRSQVTFILLESCKKKSLLKTLEEEVPRQIAQQEAEIEALFHGTRSLEIELEETAEIALLDCAAGELQINQSMDFFWAAIAQHQQEVAKITRFTDQVLSLCGETPPVQQRERALDLLPSPKIHPRVKRFDEPRTRDLLDTYGRSFPSSHTISSAIAPTTQILEGSLEDGTSTHPLDPEGWKSSETITPLSIADWVSYNDQIHGTITTLQKEICQLLEEMDTKNKELEPICDQIKQLQNRLHATLSKKEGTLRDQREVLEALIKDTNHLAEKMIETKSSQGQELSEYTSQALAVEEGTRQLKADTKEYVGALCQILLRHTDLF